MTQSEEKRMISNVEVKSFTKDPTEKIALQRLSVLRLAVGLGNISEACRRKGMDRTSFYVYKKRFAEQGLDGLKDQPPVHKTHPQTTSQEHRQRVLDLALENPRWGANYLSNRLEQEDIFVSGTTVHSILAKQGLSKTRERAIKSREKWLEANPELSSPISDSFGLSQFEVIYADPPWRFAKGWISKQAPIPYDTMSLEDIKNLPVERLCAPNCALFLWSVSCMLPEAISLMESWGFQFTTIAFVWVKSKKDNSDVRLGLGRWVRQGAEICLLGIRGAPSRLNKSVSSVVISPRRRHSEKPPEVRARIVELLGDVPKLELFAREKVEGWSAWGNEVQSDIRFP